MSSIGTMRNEVPMPNGYKLIKMKRTKELVWRGLMIIQTDQHQYLQYNSLKHGVRADPQEKDI